MKKLNSKKWCRVPIVELCEAHVDCVNRTAPIVDSPTPYKMIRTTNVRDGYIDTENVRYVTEETYKKWTRRLIPKRGDVILTREAPLGEVGKIRSDDQIFLGQRLYQFRTNPKKLDADFLLYALLYDDLQGQVRGYGSGATVEHMRLEDIPCLEISLPRIEEQRKIASILSAYDNLIENNLRRIKILEEMAQNLYREWFVKFRFPGHEQTRFIDSPLGKIPEGWDVHELGMLVHQIRAGVNPDLVDPKTPYFGLEHFPRKSISLSDWGFAGEVKSTKLVFNKGDILFGKIRPYFHKVGVAPLSGVCSSDTIVMRVRSRDWFGLVLGYTSSVEFVEHATATSQGTKMPRANWEVLVKYQIPIPPRSILGQFNEFMSEIVNQLHNLIFRNQALCNTRDMLLPKLISGELDVSELDITISDEEAA